jgi:hypothetical protein
LGQANSNHVVAPILLEMKQTEAVFFCSSMFSVFAMSNCLIRARRPKAKFLEVTDAEATDTQALLASGAGELIQLHKIDLPDRDDAWRKQRRGLFTFRLNVLPSLAAQCANHEAEFAASVKLVFAGASDIVSEYAVLSDFTTTALDRLAESETTAAPSQGPGSQNAREKYASLFLERTDRTVADGAFGATSPDTQVSDAPTAWSDEQWAIHWLTLGGFEPS